MRPYFSNLHLECRIILLSCCDIDWGYRYYLREIVTPKRASNLIMTIGIQHMQSVRTIKKNLRASTASSCFFKMTGRADWRSCLMMKNILTYKTIINITWKEKKMYFQNKERTNEKLIIKKYWRDFQYFVFIFLSFLKFS